MLVLGIDLETTGLDVTKDKIIEVGAALYDSETWEALRGLESFIWEPSYPSLSEEITEITGIKEGQLVTEGVPLAHILPTLQEMFDECGAVVAHNADFDRGMLLGNLKNSGLAEKCRGAFERDWICTAYDIPHTKPSCRKLSHMALDYGVTIDPSKLHRAVDDVDLMINMLVARGVDFNKDVSYFNEPWVILRAIIPPPWTGRGGDGGVGKNFISKLGYSWQVPRNPKAEGLFEKCWVKAIKESEIEAEKKALGEYRGAVIA